LKGLADAVAARNKILQAFEQAEAEEDPTRHRDLLTFVLVGAGPTGVEMAGALAGLVRSTLRSEYRRIDPSAARIILVDLGSRVLGAFADGLSRAAKERLERLGVEVRLGHGVDQIDADGVTVEGERIASKTVIWTAGVAPSPAGKWLKAPMDRAGRVRIQTDLTVPGHPEIFVIGDTASLDQDGHPLPGVAQVAMQQGRYAGNVLHRRIAGESAPPPFRYFDKGNMAVVEKGSRSWKREGACQRPPRVVGVGGRPPRIRGEVEPSGERVPAMGLDLSDGAARLSPDRGLPCIGQR
jgi:NADH dehydrogenase FAD-containing subunit